MLESAYEQCLAAEMAARGLAFTEQQVVPLTYRGAPIEAGYRVDFVVEEQVVVELKAVARFEDVHMAQLITYLKLTGCHVGLLLNFDVPVMRQGIHRVVYRFPEPPSRASRLRG